jgi:hypothetical protein
MAIFVFGFESVTLPSYIQGSFSPGISTGTPQMALEACIPEAVADST